jgi:hypothetical protein
VSPYLCSHVLQKEREDVFSCNPGMIESIRNAQRNVKFVYVYEEEMIRILIKYIPRSETEDNRARRMNLSYPEIALMRSLRRREHFARLQYLE